MWKYADIQCAMNYSDILQCLSPEDIRLEDHIKSVFLSIKLSLYEMIRYTLMNNSIFLNGFIGYIWGNSTLCQYFSKGEIRRGIKRGKGFMRICCQSLEITPACEVSPFPPLIAERWADVSLTAGVTDTRALWADELLCICSAHSPEHRGHPD